MKCFAAVMVIVDVTDESAQAKYEEYTRYADDEGGRFFVSTAMGVDLSEYDWDTPIETFRE